MSLSSTMAETLEIVVDELFPHTPEMMWKTLVTPEIIGRWFMVPMGFEAKVGNRFTYQTTPAGEWDGVIHCEVLEVVPNERLVYSWKGGHPSNKDYGSRLETLVTWTISKADGGTRLRLVHSGFQPSRNAFAFSKMSEGWPKVVEKVGTIAGEAGSTSGESSVD
jgi:uncharacterized protein YndB with AHSA1/START domain